jgi:hypothetical protein
MFALDHTIDAVQNAKKTAVTHFVKNEAIARSLSDLVDAETSLAKASVKVTTEALTKLGDEITKQTKQVYDQVSSYDWAKNNPFFTEITKWTAAPVTKASKNG